MMTMRQLIGALLLFSATVQAMEQAQRVKRVTVMYKGKSIAAYDVARLLELYALDKLENNDVPLFETAIKEMQDEDLYKNILGWLTSGSLKVEKRGMLLNLVHDWAMNNNEKIDLAKAYRSYIADNWTGSPYEEGRARTILEAIQRFKSVDAITATKFLVHSIDACIRGLDIDVSAKQTDVLISVFSLFAAT